MPRSTHAQSTLKHLLENYTNDDLRRLIKAAGKTTSASRKADLVQVLCNHLVRAENLKRHWNALDDLSRKAVSFAYHRDGFFDVNAFFAQYQALPDPPGQGRRFYREMMPLDLFVIGGRIPDEIMPQLGQRVYPKDPFRLTEYAEVPGLAGRVKPGAPIYTVDTQWPGNQDLLMLLDMAGQGRIKVAPKSKRLTLDSGRWFASRLCNEDFLPGRGRFEVNESIRPSGLHRFAENSGLLNQGRLTSRGRTYLESRNPAVLLKAFEQWTEKGAYDEFERVRTKRNYKPGKISPAGPRREAVIEALSWCPVGVWLDAAEFARAVLAWGFTVGVEPGGNTGAQSPVYDEQFRTASWDATWNANTSLYIKVLLFEYLGSIGALDLVYTDPDDLELEYNHFVGPSSLTQGLLFVRINALGAYLFGQASAYKPPAEKTLQFTIDKDMVLRWKDTPRLTPLINDRLGLFTRQQGEGVYQLSIQQVFRSLEEGAALRTISAFIRRYHKGPAPGYVNAWLKNLEEKSEAFKQKGTAIIVRVKSEAFMDIIRNDPELSSYCKPYEDRAVVVSSRKESAFRQRLKELEQVLL